MIKFIIKYFYIWFIPFFLIWMLFFDDNSWYVTHSKLDEDIEQLEDQILLMRSEIEKDKIFLKEMDNDKAVEKYLRETYKLKTKGEEVFLIEYDTVN